MISFVLQGKQLLVLTGEIVLGIMNQSHCGPSFSFLRHTNERKGPLPYIDFRLWASVHIPSQSAEMDRIKWLFLY
jgi:hypothetical protein